MAGLLIGLGLDGPNPDDLVPASESNEQGHWESETVHLCNVHVLAARGGTTYAPPELTSGWESDPSFRTLQAEAAAWFAATSRGRPVVLKDPRMCITLPLWKRAIPSLAAVLVLRDPLQVACSLQARDNLPILLGLALWDRYIRSAAQGLEGLPVLVVEYNALLADPLKWSDVVSAFLADVGVRVDVTKKSSAPQLLDSRLRHQQGERTDYGTLVDAEREIMAVLLQGERSHSPWEPPPLPVAPSWVDDVLQLRREVAIARHELHWTQKSRSFRAASAIWRLTGNRPRAFAAPDDRTDW
jgi:hypothetical protein